MNSSRSQLKHERGQVELFCEFQIFDTEIIVQIFPKQYLLFQKSDFTMNGASAEVANLNFFTRHGPFVHNAQLRLLLSPDYTFLRDFQKY